MKVKYKDQVIEVCEGATLEVVRGDLVITTKDQEFKYGDILVVVDGSCPFIFKGIKDGLPQYIIGLATDKTLMFSTGRPWTSDKIRKATDKESIPLIDAIEKSGKKWNPETKQIEDILKVGDICIFWDDDKSESCVATYNKLYFPHKYPDGFNFASEIKVENKYACWKNAIKCTSLEQYINFKK